MASVISAGRPAIVVARPLGPHGPPGPAGPIGPAGPAGPAGGDFIHSGTGAVSRTQQDKMRDHVSVLDFGAKADLVPVTGATSIASTTTLLTVVGAAFTAADIGKLIVVPGAGAASADLVTTIASMGADATKVNLTATAGTTLSAVSKTVSYGSDNTAAFNAALTAHKVVYVPTGNYGVAGTIGLNTAGHYLEGNGTNATIITSMSQALPLIKSGANVQDWGVKHMSLTRAGVATAGGHGIYNDKTCDQGYLDDLHISKHYCGLSLTSTGYARLMHTTVVACVSHGIQMIASTDGGATVFQWNMEDVFSAANGGDGIHIDTAGSTSGGASMGNWLHISSFDNVGPAVRCMGIPAAPIFNLRVSSLFVGEDGAPGEVVLDTYSYPSGSHSFTDVQMELGGGGFYITANNGPVTITDLWICNMASVPAITMLGTQLTVTGAVITACGGGILVNAGRAKITQCILANNASYGLFLATGTGPHLIANNDFNYGGANATNSIAGADTVADGSKIINNIGYNPAGVHTITVGASPFTYKAHAAGEDVYITGGTGVAIQVNGTTVFNGVTNVSIPLGPRETVLVVYTTAPTMVGMRR